MNWFKITCWLQKGDKSLFDISVEKQTNFMKALGDPHDIVDRSYKQYRCQNIFLHRGKVTIFNIISGLAFPFVFIYYVIKGYFIHKRGDALAVIEDKRMEEVVPKLLIQRYQPKSEYWNCESTLSLHDVPFILKLIKRAPFSPYYIIKVLINLSKYSSIISFYHPKAIIQFGEFSFSRNALTEYCHQFGIKHINVMHGEKLFFIRDSFVCFDEFYVWDNYYANLFKSLEAEPTQFIVSLPESLRIDLLANYKASSYADYKYYLATNSEMEIKSIVNSLSFVKANGMTLKYRPHPRYTNMNVMRKYVDEADIEDCINVGILESIASLEYAVGSYTTVLSQAFFSGKKVVMDDVTYKKQYDQLKDMKYILSDYKHKKLSEFQSQPKRS